MDLPPSLEQTLRIRPASAEDVEAIAAIHVEGYWEAYRGLVDDAVLAARSPALRRRVWGERLEGPQERQFVVVADRDGEVVGFSSGRAATPDEGGDGERIGCWENLYLRPDLLGSAESLKTGLALHEATVARLAGCGFTEGVNFVIEGNDRARRFFEAVGWKPDGTQRVLEGVVHHRHRRPLP
jgi:L-amino acid N-acyltransferase YncA